jgi:bacterioferritin-associated ferredoxin
MTQATPKQPQDVAHVGGEMICHCRQVPYATVEGAIQERRACTLAQVQRETTACTRCFGCRFEIERVLKAELGDAYVPTAVVTREVEPESVGPLRRVVRRARGMRQRVAPLAPQKMYMPILEGYGGHDVTTRVVLFNLHDERQEQGQEVSLRADLTALDGEREDVWRATIAPRHSTVLNVREMLTGRTLPDGIGLIKLILDSDTVHSLRPYFHLISPGGVTSTHEKRGPRRPHLVAKRGYHWILPVAPKPRPGETYFFLTNTQTTPIEGRSLIFRDTEGREQSVEVPVLELDQAVCVPLHEHIPEIAAGTARGSVRLAPSVHVAGWILHRDVEADLWRVQHL